MELLQFIFSSFWIFFGTLMILVVGVGAIEAFGGLLRINIHKTNNYYHTKKKEPEEL